MTTTLIFVRHGETTWNQELRYQGQCDSPLSELGLLQAEKLGQFLSRRKIDAVYSSDLGRAVATAQKIAQHHALIPIVDERLREMNFGVWEGLTRSEVLAKYPDLYQARYEDRLNLRIPGGELPREVVERLHRFLGERLSEHDGETIVAVSHGGALRLVLASLLHIPLEYSSCLSQSNAGISELIYDQGAACPWQVVTINSTCHLL